ncbi:hypothetical protein A2303_03550 [Candidatus Falkowbacteria bacterium RIFOXYB2_FULL_47_14]|uniref:Uncharacterized protein n=1 Tax=Candidatus Falkowbacteria bacterium RIFOXYA2_FULL_47_19 TaxID=1797994 RepID=A0A1F5SI63_9BACT|nr:MAG: hypothetical protein A2227_03095 [Candidatus Falkowbacteria bacterium RIFOXYA2_FULL_47_19]OGF36702.1 MAG: hypothetical protein A2468_02675 [Candidatus Falkowbacteria bacterium RIFOXYC2_FULL_46_15]OGF42474.1 MAG: hypothetical protein A2303_03550 [Candidatus Falkowbacteria bacterium RIFOXYB2_FULL_47_14]
MDMNKKPDNLIKPLSGQTGGQVTIHTMPERFFFEKPTAQKSKFTGILILSIGAVLLLAIFAAAYFYFSMTPGSGNAPAPADTGILNNVTNNVATNNAPAETIGGNDATNENNTDHNPPVAVEPSFIEAEEDFSSSTAAVPATPSPETATSSSEIETPVPTITIEIKAAPDGDYDGLSDIEETLLGTNKDSGDSDGDGYGDLPELLNLYNPAGTGLLVINTSIERYINSKYQYKLFYPETWELISVGAEDSIMIKADNGQFFQVIIQPNSGYATIEDWYVKQFEVESVKSSQKIYKKGWRGIKGENGLTIYLLPADGKNIFTLNYNVGADNTSHYGRIFDMMMNSLEIIE